MNSALVPSNSAKVRTKNKTIGSRNMTISIANAGSINSNVRSRGPREAACRASAGVAALTLIAGSSCLPWEDQAVGNRPAQHHRRTGRQRRDAGGVLQVDRDWRGAIDIHRIAQDVAEKRAAANRPGEPVGTWLPGRARARRN